MGLPRRHLRIDTGPRRELAPAVAGVVAAEALDPGARLRHADAVVLARHRREVEDHERLLRAVAPR
jgi:hypothetical protein